MFARIVGRYDLMNSLMTFGRDAAWRGRTVELAQPRPGEPALDLATGTGELALGLARWTSPVVAIDSCYEMLAAAQAKSRREGASPRLLMADAHHLPFPDDTFRCVVMGFALRNVANIPAVLREAYRVVRPEGRMACLELTPPAPGLVGSLLRLYLYRLVPLVGRVVTGDADAYRYLPNSLTGFPSAETLAQMLTKAGWREVGFQRLGLGAVAIHHATK